MFATDIPHRLKALREAAGLSIRALADKLGMSSSGCAHYESPSRFKDPFLPMDMAYKVARALTPYGVQPDHVMALAGSPREPDKAEPEGTGFSEDVACPWSPNPKQPAAMDAAVRAMTALAGNPGTFQITRAILALGLLCGDILIIDRNRLPTHGELSLARVQVGSGHMVVAIGRYLPPLLYTAESLTDGVVLDVTSGAVTAHYPILCSFRAQAATAPDTAKT